MAAVTDFDKSATGTVDPRMAVSFTADEAAIVMMIIRYAWQQTVMSSRRNYELLASVEDKMLEGGAVIDPKDASVKTTAVS